MTAAAVSAFQSSAKPSAEEHLDESLKMSEYRALLSTHDAAVRGEALSGHALQQSSAVGERTAVLEQKWETMKTTLDKIEKVAIRAGGWVAFGAGTLGVWASIQILQWAVGALR